MAVATMAKRNDTPVRIDNDVLEDCRIAAAFQGKSIAEYVSDILRPIAKRDIEEGYAKRIKGDEDSSPPKRKRSPR